MKRIQTILLIVSLGLNVLLAFSISKLNSEAKKTWADTLGPFSITNLNSSIKGEDYIVAYKNGLYWWNIDGQTVSMNIGLKEGVTLRLDESTGQIKSTTIELSDSKGTGCYFTDLNADGIPDRKNDADGEQIFYNGRFTPIVFKNGQRFIVVNGVDSLLKFNGEQWVIQKD